MTDSALPSAGPAAMGLVDRFVVSLAIGLSLYVASCWLVPADPTLGGGFEVDWQQMSSDPFGFPGRLPHRILAPLLAWMIGQGGEHWHTFTEALHVLMLASVCFVAQHLGARVLDAALVTAAIAFTAPVQMYKLHWNGYTDPICFTLFLWAIVAARNPYVFWSLFFVNLTNHELAGFLVPWLWYLRRRQDGRWLLDLGLLGAACALYVGYYLLVKAIAPQQLFSADYFTGHPLFPGGSFIVWNLAAVHLVTTFGPVLALLAWHQHQKAQVGERWHLWLVALGIFVIFCIAFDWARHSNLMLLPLMVAGVRFLQTGNVARGVFVALLGLTLVLFWMVPPWTSSAWPTSVFIDGPTEWREANNPEKLPMMLLLKPGIVIIGDAPGGLSVSFGTLTLVLQEWLPVIWKPLLLLHLIGGAIWALGFAMTKWLRPPSVATATLPPPPPPSAGDVEHVSVASPAE